MQAKRSTLAETGAVSALNTTVVPAQIQKEVTAIVSTLGDVKTHDWKKRMDQFDRLKLLFMQLCNEHAEDLEAQQRAVATVMR